MVDENRSPSGDQVGPDPTGFGGGNPGADADPGPARYFGPFGPPPGTAEETRPIGIGNWQIDDPVQTRPVAPTEPTVRFPAPPGVPSMQPLPPVYPAPVGPPAATTRKRRGAAIVVGAGVVALVVGSAAGFGGARLAQGPLAAPAPATSAPTDPTTEPAPAPSSTAPVPRTTPVPPPPGQLDTVKVAATVLPSTVMIRVGQQGSGSIGSGFVLDTSGHVMTNNHVVADAAKGEAISVVFADGRRTSATLVGRSPSYDLAVIKVRRTSGLTPMKLGDSKATKVGEPVVAVGAPLGLPGTVTQGIISAKDRPVVVNNADQEADAPSAYINGLQTDAPINPGNSGGPLIDAGARVIGVNSAILTLGQSRGQSGSIGLGFAIPINQAVQIGGLLIKNGKATYPVIGASVGENSDGVALTSVEEGGPASKAGLRENDVVTAIDGRPVEESQELIVAIRTHRPGERVVLQYERGQRKATANVTLGSREG